MARYRKIETRIWNDEKFRAFSDDAKLLFFFLLTHPHLTALGAMRVSLGGLAGELSWAEGKFRKAWAEIIAKEVVEYDKKSLFLSLPNFLKYNIPESPNVVKSWAQSLDYLPECPLKKLLIQRVKTQIKNLSESFQEALPKAFGQCSESFSKDFQKSMPNQEQEPKPKQEPKQEPQQKQEKTKKTSIADGVIVEGDESALAVINIPLNNGGEYPLTNTEIKQWQTLYPAIDVRQELRNIRGWNLANPKKRKTKSGILSHINSWLAREQNRATQLASTTTFNGNRSPPFRANSVVEHNQRIAEQWIRDSESNVIEGEVE